MKYIKSFNEALKPSQFRRYVKSFNKERYEELFQNLKKKYSGDRNAYRIYFPLIKTDQDLIKSDIKDKVIKLLDDNEFDIIDYATGRCKGRKAKNESKIGKILTSLSRKNPEAKELMAEFVSDPIRKSSQDTLLVCLSRHPYDIAGADTDRHWTNCMTIGTGTSKYIDELVERRDKIFKELSKHLDYLNPLRLELEEYNSDEDEISNDEMEYYDELTTKVREYENKYDIRKLKEEYDDILDGIEERQKHGQNSRYLIQDVKQGSLISYLIKENDKDIKNPIANWNIKPFVNSTNSKDVLLVADARGYGNVSKDFKETVNTILAELNGDKSGYYCINSKIYDDGKSAIYKLDIDTILDVDSGDIHDIESYVENYVSMNDFKDIEKFIKKIWDYCKVSEDELTDVLLNLFEELYTNEYSEEILNRMFKKLIPFIYKQNSLYISELIPEVKLSPKIFPHAIKYTNELFKYLIKSKSETLNYIMIEMVNMLNDREEGLFDADIFKDIDVSSVKDDVSIVEDENSLIFYYNDDSATFVNSKEEKDEFVRIAKLFDVEIKKPSRAKVRSRYNSDDYSDMA